MRIWEQMRRQMVTAIRIWIVDIPKRYEGRSPMVVT
jgi:hypothetical protein